ncbi:S1 family peptidase [Amycolatopsis sp. WGS_07]|uniref:S1 family peptidase n=1 Tax=Amycolatopsis sp. WGS_07 TaxID=3076764 RepID=UPI00387304F0
MHDKKGNYVRSRKLTATSAAALVATSLFTPAAAAASGSSPGASPQLVGGHPAPASVTYIAAVMFDAPAHGERDATTCGSVAVLPDWLLTAAQCVTDLGLPDEIPAKDKRFHVRAGLDRTKGGTTADVSGIYVNPHWTGKINPPAETADLALLHVNRPLRVRPVPLAWTAPRAGTRLVTYGWGSKDATPHPDRHNLPTRLQELHLNVIPDAECADAGISRGEFCTGHKDDTGRNIGPGYGDAGGPAIVHDDKGRPWIVGIDSHGGSPVPGASNTAFTSTAHYIDWIWDTIAENS